MRIKALRQKIANQPPCLACEHALGMIQQKGIHDVSYIIRRIAEDLWSNESIDAGEREYINEKLATIVRLMCGNLEETRQEVQEAISDLDNRIAQVPQLARIWCDLKEALTDACST